MARQLSNKREIERYLSGIKAAADHHGDQVNEIVLPLADMVLKRIASDTKSKIKVYERNGAIARTCWITFRGRRSCFSYSHVQNRIELRERSTQGSVLAYCDNSTTARALQHLVAKI